MYYVLFRLLSQVRGSHYCVQGVCGVRVMARVLNVRIMGCATCGVRDQQSWSLHTAQHFLKGKEES